MAVTKLQNESGLPVVVHTIAADATGALTAGVSAAGGLFAASLGGAGTAPALAAGANAGTGASVGSQAGHDLGGSFVLTVGTTPAAGALATVTFGTPLAAAPASIVVTCWDQTSATGVAVGPTSISGTGFTVSGPASTAAHHLLVNYHVTAS
jgi:hypothetical protein